MMKTGRTNFQAALITIHHDWEPTVQRMKKLISLKSNFTPEVFGKQADHYCMKALGTLSVHHHSEYWYKFSGPSINATMPWLKDLLLAMQDLEPDDGCISFLQGAAGGHVDLSDWKSALNYIFYSTDPTAYTWLKDNDQIEQHPSTVGSGWIIDTQKEHGVSNNGTRYNLSIHFKKDYDTVIDWFNSQHNLTFGS